MHIQKLTNDKLQLYCLSPPAVSFFSTSDRDSLGVSSSYACSPTPVCIYTVLAPCAGISQVMFTPTDTSSTPPPTNFHTHTHTHTHTLPPALISCLPHRHLAPRANLTSIRHTPSALPSDTCFGFIAGCLVIFECKFFHRGTHSGKK